MQPTLTLNCHKLVQNIKIRINVRILWWMCVHPEDITIKWIECMFISAILNLSLWGQQSLPILWASKIKMEFCSKKKTCFTLNGQNNLWGCFYKRKKMMFWIFKDSGVLCTAYIARLMDACLVSCSRGCQQPCQFVFYFWTNYVHKISVFKEFTLVCPLGKFQI